MNMVRALILLFLLVNLSKFDAADTPSDKRIAEILGFCSVGEDGGVGFKGDKDFSAEEMHGFFAWFKQSDDPLISMNQLVTDSSQRSVAVVVAASTLDDDRFYEVGLKLLERFGTGSASEEELRRMLMLPEEKRGLLAVNFRDTHLQSALNGCLTRGVADQNYIALIKGILSGDAARDVFRKAGEGYPERYGPLAKQALENISVAAHSVPDNLTSHPPEPKNGERKAASTGVSEAASSPPGSIWPWIAGAVMLILGALVLLKRRS